MERPGCFGDPAFYCVPERPKGGVHYLRSVSIYRWNKDVTNFVIRYETAIKPIGASEMRMKILGTVIACLVVVAAVACGETTPSASPTQPPPDIQATPLPTAPTPPATETEPVPSEPAAPAAATVTGTVTYRQRIALSPDAVLEVKLVDISRADAPAVTIGEHVIGKPGQVPIAFEIEYDPADIDERFTYVVQARIMEGDKLAFISDTKYPVITRDQPSQVDLVLVKVGGAPSEPAVPATASITGTVTYRERIALSPDAVVEVKLVDISRADAPALTIGEQVIENPGQVPIAFEIEYDPAEIDDRFTYAVQARIMEGDRLAFINDTAYHVITRDSPTSVEMALVMVAAPPAGPDEPDEPEMKAVAAPVESVEVLVSDTEKPAYTLKIVSGLPGGCASFHEYVTSVDGETVTVNVTNLVPTGPVACTAIYGRHEGEVVLDGKLTPDTAYTVVVNDEVTNSFLARDAGTADWVVEASPIETVEVVASESDPPAYSLNVVSTLPQGSSCSRFNGYDIARRFAGRIELTVTHLKVAPGEVRPCTADLPVVSTDVPLGSEFTPGETYTVVVNGDVTETLTALGPVAFEAGPCRITRASQLPIEFEYKGTVPTGFDGINQANCTFTKPVKTVTVTLSGPANHTEIFTLSEPSTEVSFPLPEGTLSISTLEIVAPGEYEREITVTSVDGETLVVSDQPGVLKTVTILESQG